MTKEQRGRSRARAGRQRRRSKSGRNGINKSDQIVTGAKPVQKQVGYDLRGIASHTAKQMIMATMNLATADGHSKQLKLTTGEKMQESNGLSDSSTSPSRMDNAPATNPTPCSDFDGEISI